MQFLCGEFSEEVYCLLFSFLPETFFSRTAAFLTSLPHFNRCPRPTRQGGHHHLPVMHCGENLEYIPST